MHPLDGPRAKAERANRQIVSLQQEFQRFFRDNLYAIGVAEYNSKAGNYSLRVKSGPQEFPVGWSVLIGEIAHDLRSALDGLTWQLALLGPSPPSFRTSFPICLHKARGERIGDRYYPAFRTCNKKGQGCLESVPRRFQTRIEAFQPYKRGNAGRHGPLVLLNELNNTDKHRVVAILASMAASLQFTGLSGGTHFRRKVTLRTKAKIGWVRDVPPNPPGGEGGIYILDLATGRLREPEMQVNVKVDPSISFGDGCDAVKGLPVIRTLTSMADRVHHIIESFSGDFPK